MLSMDKDSLSEVIKHLPPKDTLSLLNSCRSLNDLTNNFYFIQKLLSDKCEYIFLVNLNGYASTDLFKIYCAIGYDDMSNRRKIETMYKLGYKDIVKQITLNCSNTPEEHFFRVLDTARDLKFYSLEHEYLCSLTEIQLDHLRDTLFTGKISEIGSIIWNLDVLKFCIKEFDITSEFLLSYNRKFRDVCMYFCSPDSFEFILKHTGLNIHGFRMYNTAVHNNINLFKHIVQNYDVTNMYPSMINTVTNSSIEFIDYYIGLVGYSKSIIENILKWTRHIDIHQHYRDIYQYNDNLQLNNATLHQVRSNNIEYYEYLRELYHNNNKDIFERIDVIFNNSLARFIDYTRTHVNEIRNMIYFILYNDKYTYIRYIIHHIQYSDNLICCCISKGALECLKIFIEFYSDIDIIDVIRNYIRFDPHKYSSIIEEIRDGNISTSDERKGISLFRYLNSMGALEDL